MEYVGFIPSVWFIWSCYFLAGVWILFCVPEIPKPVIDTSASFFSTENIKGFVKGSDCKEKLEERISFC